MKVRLGIALLVAVALTGCGGTTPAAKHEAAALPLWQRVLLGGDMPGFTPAQAAPAMLDLGAFVDQAKTSFVRITPERAVRQLTADGFSGAISTVQRLAGKHPLVASTVIELGSAAQAEHAMAWAYADSTSPGPGVCNAVVEPFHVPGIPGATGVRRSRAKDAAGSGPKDPFESFEIQFADGRFLYDLHTLDARPGEVSQDDLLAAAKTLHDRVAGSPPLTGGRPQTSVRSPTSQRV